MIPSIEEQNKILKLALKKMGKFLRQMPPGNIDDIENTEISLINFLTILAGGKDRDPEGKEYVYYFVKLAEDEIKKGADNT